MKLKQNNIKRKWKFLREILEKKENLSLKKLVSENPFLKFKPVQGKNQIFFWKCIFNKRMSDRYESK
jgi:hypothetical protein